MGLMGCLQKTPWFSIVNLCAMIGIAAMAYVSKGRLEEKAGGLFDFKFVSMLVAIGVVFLILVDFGITIQAVLTNDYFLERLLGDKETRKEGGCCKCLGDLVCTIISWTMFIISYVVTILTIFILIAGTAMPLLAICMRSLCDLNFVPTGNEINSIANEFLGDIGLSMDAIDNFDTPNDLGAQIANDMLGYITKHEEKAGLNLGIGELFCLDGQDYLTDDCILFNGINCVDDICEVDGFCQSSKGIVQLCFLFGAVGVCLVLFQVHFLVIGRGNINNTSHYKKTSKTVA